MYLLLFLSQDSCYSFLLLTGRGADLPVKPRFFPLPLVSSRIHQVQNNRTKRTRLRMGVVVGEGGGLSAEVKPHHSSGSKRRVLFFSSLPACQLCRWRATLVLLIVSRLSFKGTTEHRKLTAFMFTGVYSRARSIDPV